MTGNDQIDYASLSDVGVRRSQNQDSHAELLASDEAHFQKQGHVFVVADGMGAHAVGELASELATDIIPLTYQKHATEGPESALEKAFAEANGSIHKRGQQTREFTGMGTTTTLLLLRPEGAWLAHVGDSRCYRIRAGKIEQLSFDHSLLWELARRQRVRPEQLQGVPSNVIVRSMGPESQVQVDIEGPHPIQAGDIFLLCSDGLSGQVTDHEIGVIASLLPPPEACQLLVDLANLRGGPDNTTVVIARANRDWSAAGADAGAAGDRPWYRRFPWPYLSLALGVLFAVAAVAMSADRSLAVLFFVLAVLAILGGIAGLALFFLVWDTGEPTRPRRKPRLKVYSSCPCEVERPLLDKLLQTLGGLEQLLREKEWETDWERFKKHQQQAESLLIQEDLVGALREYCRALRPLTATLAKNRHKEDVPSLVWDKVVK